MLRITAPDNSSGRVGSVRFVDGVAEVASLTKAERHALTIRGYRIEEISEPEVMSESEPVEFD